MLDVELGTGVIEGMGPDQFAGGDRLTDLDGGRTGVAWIGEVGTI